VPDGAGVAPSGSCGEELEGASPPLRDSSAEAFGWVDGPEECGADAFSDDGVRGGFGVELGADAAVGLAGEDGGERVCAEGGDPVGDACAQVELLPAA